MTLHVVPLDGAVHTLDEQCRCRPTLVSYAVKRSCRPALRHRDLPPDPPPGPKPVAGDR